MRTTDLRKVESIALLPHPGKEEALELARLLIPVLESEGVRVWVDAEIGEKLGRKDLISPGDELTHCSFAMVLGGDGALLKAARLVAPHGVPIIGVNLGRLGFLTEVEPSGLEEALGRLFRGEYEIEERMMLHARILRGERSLASFYGLNDAVVTRGVFARVIEVETLVDEQPVATFLGDGVVVSTPTGSTAYSLSAGGPIVNPRIQALIVTPICPHTVGARSLVACPDERVRIRLSAKAQDGMLTVDGQVGEALQPGDVVEIGRADKPAKLVKTKGRTFYALLRRRFLPRAHQD